MGDGITIAALVVAFAAGLISVGGSPCVGPVLGGILTLGASTETTTEGMTVLGSYSLGLGVPFFLAGWSLEYFFRAMAQVRSSFRRIEVVSGSLLVAVGWLIATPQLTVLNRYFGFLNGFVEAAESWLL